MTELIRLILTPDPLSQQISTKTVSFIAVLESTGDFVVNSHKPLADGARELLARGFDPAELLTMRHAGKAYDSFKPMPIGYWAGRSYAEGAKTPVQGVPWTPFQNDQQLGNLRTYSERKGKKVSKGLLTTDPAK